MRFFSPVVLLFLAIWLVLMIGGRSRFFQDPGTFWHTVVGEQILGSRGFFQTDSFTFTHADKPWIPHQWLGECAMAVVHRCAGLDGLLVLAVTVIAALYASLGAHLMRVGGLHYSLVTVLVGLSIAASSGHFHVRPHLATMVGFAVLFRLLCAVEAERAPMVQLYWIIPLCLVWANFHGGVLGGLVTFFLVSVGWVVVWKCGYDTPLTQWSDVGRLAMICAAATVVLFVNPYGMEIPRTWLQIYQMPSLPRLIREHAPVDLQDPNTWVIVLLGIVYLTVLFRVSLAEWRVTWLVPLLWFVLALMRVRHAPLFAISALIAIAEMFPQTRWAFKLEASGSDLYSEPDRHLPPITWKDRLRVLLVPSVLVVLAVSLQVARIPVPLLGSGWARLDERNWPVELLDTLREFEHERPGGTRIFNEYGYGGFLIYHTPGYRVFIDDRCELFGDAFLTRYAQDFVIDPAGSIAEWEAAYGVFDYALIATREPSQSGFGMDDYFRQSPDWLVVKRTRTATLYRRNVS